VSQTLAIAIGAVAAIVGGIAGTVLSVRRRRERR